MIIGSPKTSIVLGQDKYFIRLLNYGPIKMLHWSMMSIKILEKEEEEGEARKKRKAFDCLGIVPLSDFQARFIIWLLH